MSRWPRFPAPPRIMTLIADLSQGAREDAKAAVMSHLPSLVNVQLHSYEGRHRLSRSRKPGIWACQAGPLAPVSTRGKSRAFAELGHLRHPAQGWPFRPSVAKIHGDLCHPGGHCGRVFRAGLQPVDHQPHDSTGEYRLAVLGRRAGRGCFARHHAF